MLQIPYELTYLFSRDISSTIHAIKVYCLWIASF